MLLRTSKKQAEVSNKDIATLLDLPLTHISHWFRTDKHFSIPGADVWFDLKDILKITDDSFDAAITEFEMVDGKYDMGNRVYSDKGISPTLNCDGASWGTLGKDYRIRKLTPVECERLQAFPDHYTKYGKDGEEISDTQRYKCLGNAVTTTVITYLIEEMFKNEE